ncbi:MAG: hypothetical protein K6F50_08815 [Kiritimatiellae bacterium]|nr:hypothetical protein [Kiritimatiellia bacterium]
MIFIKQPSTTVDGGKARLSAHIVVDGAERLLYVDVDKRYAQFLCYERSDAFILGLLHFAMQYGHDITSEAPMTSRLYLQLTEQFLPAFAKLNGLTRSDNKNGNGGWHVKIYAPLAPEIEHPDGGNAIGTGCSCGVDSMHVYAAHPAITHGCVWNVHGITHDETNDTRNIGWANLLRQAREFSSEVGVELVVGDSNYDRGCFEDLRFDGRISYGNLFFIFALQKLWSRYYVASGYDIAGFDMSGGLLSDPAHYEWVLFAFCSLSYITVAIDGVDRPRIEKIVALVKYPLSKRFLNVCWNINATGRNCSYLCAKCMRTMLELWCTGVLDQYGTIFDVQYFKRHKHEYLAEYYRCLLHGDEYAREMRPYIRRKKIALRVKVLACVIVIKKILRKCLRGGRRDVSRFSPR